MNSYVSIEKIRFFNMMLIGLPVGWSGADYPIESGKDTAGNVSLLGLGLGGDVMSKAQAQKHRAVSFDTVITSSHQERSWWFFFLRVSGMGLAKKIFIVVMIWLLFSLAAAFILPRDVGVDVGQRMGFSAVLLAAYALHPAFGVLLALGMPFGSDNAEHIAFGTKLIMAIFSVLLTWLAATLLLQRGRVASKILSLADNAMPRQKTFFKAAIAAISFAFLATANEFLQTVLPYYNANGSLYFNENMGSILTNVFLIQICVGILLTLFIFVFKGIIDPLFFMSARKDNSEKMDE